jgi:CheY-like chemotaxis protein
MSVADTAKAEPFRFLVVDDSRAIQSIIRRVLEAVGYPEIEVRVASEAETALQILSEFTPDLVITDWHMPKMTGLEFLKAIRNQSAFNLQVGFVTTESNPAKLEEARLSGAVFILNKPFDDVDLISLVKHWVPLDRSKPNVGTVDTSKFIISLNQVEQHVKNIIPAANFQLSPSQPLISSHLTANNLLGLYGFGGQSQPVAGLAVLDMKAVALMWGCATGQTPVAVRQMMMNSELEDSVLTSARKFMEDSAKDVTIPADKQSLALTRSSVVAQSFRRLSEIMANNQGRADFTIDIPSFGTGHIVFLMV